MPWYNGYSLALQVNVAPFSALSHVWRVWAPLSFGFQLDLAKGGSSEGREGWGQGSYSLSPFGGLSQWLLTYSNSYSLLVLGIAPFPYSFRPWLERAPHCLVPGHFTILCWFPLTLPTSLKIFPLWNSFPLPSLRGSCFHSEPSECGVASVHKTVSFLDFCKKTAFP